MIQFDNRNPEDHAYLRSWAMRYGALYSRPGNGISHYLHLERFARPGRVLVGADSHTTMAGALGMLAIGAGATEVAVAMAGRPYVVERPRVVGVELRGRLEPWVQSKDVVLELLRRRGVRGGRGCIFEFHGEGVATLSATDRGTICNMVMETGATTGIFPSDERTRAWLREQGREEHWLELAADPDAEYDEAETIDLGELEPLIALPSSPGNVVPVREAAGEADAAGVRRLIGQLFVRGSRDRRGGAARADGRSRARPDGHPRVAADPGHDRARRRLRRPARGRGADTGARLRPLHRHGPGAGGGRRLRADVQPQLPRAQRDGGRSRLPLLARDRGGDRAPRRDRGSARTRRSTRTDAAAREPGYRRPPDRPSSPTTAGGSSSRRAATSSRPRPSRRSPEEIAGRVLIKVPDDVSTGDMAPDGALGVAIWSNIPACARYMFRRFDPEFPARAEDWGGGIVVGRPQLRPGLEPRAGGVRRSLPRRARGRGQELRAHPSHEPDCAGNRPVHVRRRGGLRTGRAGGRVADPAVSARPSRRAETELEGPVRLELDADRT